MGWLLAVMLVVGCGGGCGDSPSPSEIVGRASEPDASPADTPEPESQPEPERVERVEGPEPESVPEAETPPTKTWPRADERERMVEIALVQWKVTDEATLRAMRQCPRHLFVPEDKRAAAYQNRPLAIGWAQTISQPTVVGEMTAILNLTPKSKVLEIGTGSGYQAAVLAEITPHVFSIEIKEPLATRAAKTLKEVGYTSVTTRFGDGYHGWPEEAPFDAIIVTAAAPHVPPPLIKQLAPGGRLVIPVGPPFARQDLVLVLKDDKGNVQTQSLFPVSFVPFTGSLGKGD